MDRESVEGIAVVVAEGEFSLDELKRFAVEVWEAIEAPEPRLLWDLSGARFSLSGREIRDLAEYVKRWAPSRPLRAAFVVTRDLEYGLTRMFEAFRDAENADTSVFRDRGKALTWLARVD